MVAEDKHSKDKIIEIEKLLQKPVILFTNNNFRYEGVITETGSMFITFHDITGKTHLMNVQTIDRIEIKEETK